MDTSVNNGKVVEIFSSIQGEGLFCGQKQTFLRLHGCNLHCSYCDTPASQENNSFNEMSPAETVQKIRDLKVTDVSITGGEPLIQEDFLMEVLEDLKNTGFRIHLETNGTLPGPMRILAPLIDIVAMDIKLPSSCGHYRLWDAHKEFLESCSGCSLFVKTVVSQDTDPDEIAAASCLIIAAGRDVPLIIQPVTGGNTPSGDLLMKLQNVALDYLQDVRVIPQCHKILGVR